MLHRSENVKKQTKISIYSNYFHSIVMLHRSENVKKQTKIVYNWEGFLW